LTKLKLATPVALHVIVKTTPVPVAAPPDAGKNDWTSVYGGTVGGDTSKPNVGWGTVPLEVVLNAVSTGPPFTRDVKMTLFGGDDSVDVSDPPLIGTAAFAPSQVPGPLGVPAADIEYCAKTGDATTAIAAAPAQRTSEPISG
jgi:hypothetical protein